MNLSAGELIIPTGRFSKSPKVTNPGEKLNQLVEHAPEPGHR